MTKASELKTAAQAIWDHVGPDVLALSRNIHARPENSFEEVYASAAISGFLQGCGGLVQRGICSLPTAFDATFGTGALTVAFCAEYDALPGIGHACGHNLIAAAAAGAALALQPFAEQLDLTVKVIGTPGEERGDGGGKILLLERGAFGGVHMAIMVHPAAIDSTEVTYLAAARLEVTYTGTGSHAACPAAFCGNALNALTITQITLGLLGSLLDPYSRINGVVDEGGTSPNVTPEWTRAVYLIRAKTLRDLERLRHRVVECFEAAGLASGCRVNVTGGERPYAEMRQDPMLLSFYRQNAQERGRCGPPGLREIQAGGPSTDMGNLSQAIPSLHPCIGIGSWPAVNHQPAFARHCVGPAAEKAVEDGALLMASTVIDIALNEEARTRLMRGTTVTSMSD
jgi:amidohydrolase